MHYTVEALVQGKEKLLEYYENASGKWKELFDNKGADDEAWSDWIAESTAYFEEECGGRLMAPEIMVWSAFGTLYSIQFGWQEAERDMARKLVKVIKSSASSDALKKTAKQAADFYALDEADTSSSSPEAA